MTEDKLHKKRERRNKWLYVHMAVYFAVFIVLFFKWAYYDPFEGIEFTTGDLWLTYGLIVWFIVLIAHAIYVGFGNVDKPKGFGYLYKKNSLNG